MATRRTWYIGDELPVLSGTVTGITGNLTGYTVTGRLLRKDDTSQTNIDVDARCTIVSESNKTYSCTLDAADITVAGVYELVLRFTSAGGNPFTVAHPLQLEVLANPFA